MIIVSQSCDCGGGGGVGAFLVFLCACGLSGACGGGVGGGACGVGEKRMNACVNDLNVNWSGFG